MPSRLLLVAAILACWSLAALPARADSGATSGEASAVNANPNAPVTHGELPALVRQAIMDNPQILIDAMKKMHEQQAAEVQQKAQAALKKNKSDLVDDPNAPSVGPKNADVTLVEFFDYHCGYCKQLFPSIVKLADNDKKLRIVFREFPILSPDSVEAAHVALAVNHVAPDKYFAFYSALMKDTGRFDEKALVDTAEKVGVNRKKLEAALHNKEVSHAIGDELMKNRKLAEDLGIRGTPGIVIGNHLFPGALPYNSLVKVIADIRNGKDKDAETDAMEP